MKYLKYLIVSTLALFSLQVHANENALDDSEELFAASCATAKTLNCGTSFWQAASSYNHFWRSAYDLTGCYVPAGTYEGKDYLYKVDAGTTPQTITITLNQNTSDLDLFAFGSCNTVAGVTTFGDCAGASTNTRDNAESITITNATGVYYIVADGREQWHNSNFMITVACGAYVPTPPTHWGYADNCTSGELLSCGDVKYVSKGGNNSFDKTNYDISNCTHAGYGYEGTDYVYHLDLGYTAKNVTLTMSNLHADMDMFLFKSCHDGTTSQFSNCAGISTASGKHDESITLNNASGKYILVVDGFTHGVNSSFTLSMTCNTQNYHASSCHDAEPLYCGESRWVDKSHHNSYDKDNYSLYGCLGSGYDYTGNDHLYKIDAGNGYGKKLIISMTGLHADLDLLLFQACESHYGSAVLAQCAGYSIKHGTADEKIIIDNASGVYYLSVDANDPWDKSGYEISVRCEEPVHNICDYATPLYCGDSKWVASPSHNNLDNRNYNFDQCLGYGSYGYSGYDHLYRIEAGNTPKDLTIKVSNLSADLDLLLFESCGSNYGTYALDHCAGSSTNPGRASETITIWGATGTYYLSVDANDPWDRSGYEISMSCYTPQVGFNCDDAIWMSCNEEKWAYAPTKNNLSGADYNFSACSGLSGSYNGFDHLYEINIGHQEKHVSIELSNLSADLDLLVFSACSANYSSARLAGCMTYSASSGSSSEHVELHDASGTYYIVVESKSEWNSSLYKLKVHCTEYGGPPITNDDHNSDGPAEEDIVHEEEHVEPPVNPTTALACGETFVGTTIGASSDYDNDDITACFETSLVYTGGDLLIPFAKASDDDVLQLTLIQESANLSLFILDDELNFISSGCRGFNFGESKTISNSDVVGEVYTDEGALTAGSYFALIEGYNRTIESDFSLTVACGGPCVSSATLTCESSISGATTDIDNVSRYTNEAGDATVGYSGGEWSVDLVIDSTSEITIDLYSADTTVDLDLFLMTDCSSNQYIASSANANSSLEQIVMTLSAGSYAIVVDGWGGSSGAFDIEVTGCADATVAIAEIAQVRDTESLNSSKVQVAAIPNPFDDQTRLRWTSKKSLEGSLEIYSIDGRKIYDKSVNLAKGTHDIILDDSILGDARGLLIYRLISEDSVFQGTMLRVR